MARLWDFRSTIGEVGSSSIARKESASSKRRNSLSLNGVKVGKEVEIQLDHSKEWDCHSRSHLRNQELLE
ncbi:hypothetical protein Tco_0504388, partial [Tanacetum coccineum]